MLLIKRLDGHWELFPHGSKTPMTSEVDAVVVDKVINDLKGIIKLMDEEEEP